jgi:protease II
MQVVRRQLTGAGSGRDEVLLQEADPSCFLHLGRTKDGALLTINSNSKTSSEVLRSRSASTPASEAICPMLVSGTA